MKGKSQAILEFLFKNRKAYTKDEILSNLTLEKENDNIVKTLYDMCKKRNFIYLVGTHRYRITPKGMNHAAISYGMSDKDIRVIPTKPEPVLSELTKVQAIGRASRGNSADVETNTNDWTIYGANVSTQLARLEKALKYKPSNKPDIKDLDQKIEVLRVISRFVDSKLSFWVEEVIKDLKG